MRAFVYSSLVAMLIGCGETKTPTGETGTDTPTADTDTPTTDTEITDTDPTTPTDPIPPEDVTFAIEGAWEGTSVVVYNVDLNTGAVGLLHASGAASGPGVTVTLPAPDPSVVVPLNPVNPDVRAAFYLSGLLDDADGDAAQDPGEVYVGVSPVLLAYIEAEGGLSLGYKLIGLQTGWNALLFEAGSDLPTPVPLDAIPVLAPETATRASIGGTFTGKGTHRIALVPGNQYGPFTDVLYDAAAGDWAITVDGEPPASHLVFGSPETPDGSALEFPSSYDDVDASGSLTAGDVAVDPACTADQRPVVLAWLPHTEDLLLTYVLAAQSGWMVIADPDGAFEILGTEVTDLVIGPCGP